MQIRPASRNAPSSAPTDSSGVAALELAYEMACCQRLLRAGFIRRLCKWGVSDCDFWALWLCRRSPPQGIFQYQLAAAVGVSAAQMSGLVERLRRQGLLAGSRADGDRRRQYWRLTTAGERLLAEIQADIGEWTKGWEIACSPQDRRAILAWLRELSQAVAKPAVCGSANHAANKEEIVQGLGRPAVGNFGGVGRPAPNTLNTSVSQSHMEAADERAHRRAS